MGFHGAKYGLPGPFSSRLKSRPGTDKLTDRRQPTLNTPFYGGRGIIGNRRIGIQVVSAAEVTFKRHWRSPAMSPFVFWYIMNSWLSFRCNYRYVHILYSIAFCHFNLVFLSPGDAVRPIALNFAWTEIAIMPAKLLAACTRLSTTVSQLFEP